MLSSDRDLVKEIIKSSGNLSEILNELINKKSEADRKEESDRKRSKRNNLLIIVGGILLAGAGAAYYFLK